MRVYYQEEDLMECFTRDYREVEHVLLHVMMHHLFFHTIMEPEENLRVWNLACDMAAENLIHMIKDRSESGKIEKKMEIRPEVLYRELLGQALTERALAEKEHQYGRDDHCVWNKTEKKKLTEYVERQWRGLRKHQGAGLGGGFGGTGGKGSRDMEVLDIHKKGKAEFRHFLRQFAVGGEEVQMDMESIDYIPYLYGLNQYGNMPLVEHLEYSEVRKLQELVIAIDTSGSCTADTVRHFMEEVYGKGLLYFTDGDGIYPRKATAYKTAFIFYHRKCEPRKVPKWAWQFELEDI